MTRQADTIRLAVEVVEKAVLILAIIRGEYRLGLLILTIIFFSAKVYAYLIDVKNK